MEGEQDPEIPGTAPISTIGESEDLVATEPHGQEDVALQESSGDSQATERIRSVQEEEDAAMQEGVGDRQATEYLNTLAKYEADEIAHPGYQNTAPDLQGIPDYASKLER